jgi:hypothetical protein
VDLTVLHGSFFIIIRDLLWWKLKQIYVKSRNLSERATIYLHWKGQSHKILEIWFFVKYTPQVTDSPL